MKLNIAERIHAQQLLPATGSYVTLKLIREAREALSFSSDEITKYDIVERDNQIHWAENTYLKDVKLDPVVEKMIVEKLTQLDVDEKLSEHQATLYSKFILDQQH